VPPVSGALQNIIGGGVFGSRRRDDGLPNSGAIAPRPMTEDPMGYVEETVTSEDSPGRLGG
jgi:hypothetical protein